MTYSPTDTIWVLLGAALVFFMQAGFALVESGFTRAKNAGNIIMKNLMDFSIGTPVYWIFGFGIMFGTSVLGGIIGTPDFFTQNDYSVLTGLPTPVFLIFQTVFCATAATIVSGAMAERTKFSSYCIYSFIISAIVYPISGHWIWGGGWLAELGFHDFAGSTVVHMVGGVAALIGAAFLGPRLGKYGNDGKAKAIPGHNLTMGALGVFILWFGWFGFNGASTLAATGDDVLYSMGNIFVNTNIAAAMATLTTMIITWVKYKKPDVSMTLNGALAGLVAITAGCAVVNPFGAAIIGMLASVVMVFGIEFIDKKLKIDDPVGAVGVHGLNGAFGTIMVGLFSADSEVGLGLFYGGGFRLLGVQTLGVVSVIAWVAVTMTLVFFIAKKTVGIRVSKEDEIKGLDLTEHGLASAYADFMPTIPPHATGLNGSSGIIDSINVFSNVPEEKAIPIEVRTTKKSISEIKMSNVTIITNQAKFDALKAAMNKIGITGITVTNVLGCGMQKGSAEYYRGVPLEITLKPKVKVEIVVCKVPVQKVIDTAKAVLFTGNFGDGKIFIYDVENVIKVRTGEEGFDALQDE